MAELDGRIITPYVANDRDRRMRIRLNFVAGLLVDSMATADDRTTEQWLSRFLCEALEDKFQADFAKIKAERDSQNASTERTA